MFAAASLNLISLSMAKAAIAAFSAVVSPPTERATADEVLCSFLSERSTELKAAWVLSTAEMVIVVLFAIYLDFRFSA